MRRPALDVVATLAVALLVSGCGGSPAGGSPSAPPPPPVTPPVVPPVTIDADLAGTWYYAGASDPDLVEPLDSRLVIDAAAKTVSQWQRSDGVGPDTWMADHLARVKTVTAAIRQVDLFVLTTQLLGATGAPVGAAREERLRLSAGELQVALPADGQGFATFLRFVRSKPLPPPESLSPETNVYAGPGHWPDRTSYTVATIRGPVTLSVGMTASPTQMATDSVLRGVEDIQIALPYLVAWFASYPSSTLYVDIDVPGAGAIGWPGALRLGSSDPTAGLFGIDDPWLLFHELTHSFFSSNGMYSWMAEGMGGFLPVVLRYDAVQAGTPPWFGPWRVSGDPTDEAGLIALIRAKSIDAMVPALTAAGLTLDTPMPQVQGSYLDGANLGRAFFGTLYLKLGRQAFFRATRALYVLHRNNGRTVNQVTYQDIYDVVLAHTPAGRVAEVEPWLRAKMGLP
jgi:hypothetical protein